MIFTELKKYDEKKLYFFLSDFVISYFDMM